jgi:ABC-type multidrug transport system ATPase subunit
VTASVDLDDVDVVLGGKSVLLEVSLSLSGGESLAIVGPNGSGKTTLLRLLATLLKPTRGQGSILGQPILSPEIRQVRPDIGLITHTPALIEELTISENLLHFARLSGNPFEDCLRALEVVGMENAADRRVGDSSFGMRRRTEIAWLLVSKPKLLLLDEAKSGLDVEARELVDALVGLTLNKSGIVVGVSHQTSQLGDGFLHKRRLASGRLEGFA